MTCETYEEFKKEFPVGSVFILETTNTQGSTCFARGVELKVMEFLDRDKSVTTKRVKDKFVTSCTCKFYVDAKPIIKKGFMKKLTTLMKKLLDADTQTLVKAGYINGDLEVTEAGEIALVNLLFMTNKADLVVMAQADLDEAEKEKK